MITILVPTLNRPQYINRLLKYYSRCAFDGKIIIGDSSNEEESAINLRNISNNPKLDIDYLHSSPGNSYNTMKEMVDRITTPYAVFCGDDDFLIPNSLNKCINFLELNKDYVGVHGQRITLELDLDGPYGNIQQITHVKQLVLDMDSAIERFSRYMNHTTATYYFVFHSDIWRKMHQINFNSRPVIYFVGEVLPCSISAISGKIGEIACLSTVFQINKTRDFLTHNIYQMIVSPDWHESIEFVRKTLSYELSNAQNISFSEAMSVVDKELWHHISSVLNKQYSEWYPKKLISRTSIPFITSPASMVQFIKYLSRYVLNKKSSPYNLEYSFIKSFFIKSLFDPLSPNYADFKIIQEIISEI